MGYSIDQFSKITGINKLVLRTWENRYEFLKAERSETNIRYYSDNLLIKALNTKFLIDNGYKISFISSQDDKEIDGLVESIKRDIDTITYSDYYVNKLIKSALNFNSNLFNKVYKECLLSYDIIEFYKQILLPTFSKIGLFWLTKRINPAQEHFLSEMFKQKIYKHIDDIDKSNKKLKTWLLFLPPNEHHEIGLLFSRFLLLQYGFNVIYLGANVPLYAVEQIAKTKKIDNTLFFSISNLSKKSISETIILLNSNFTKSNNYLVSKSVLNISSEFTNKIKLVESIDHFIKIISK